MRTIWACVGVLAALTIAVHAGTCTVNANTKNQVIDGFGFSSAWCGTLPPTKTVGLFDILGFSILRIRIDQNYYWSEETTNAKAAHAYGATVFGSPWTGPPAWNSNGQGNGGYLLPEHYRDYALYLKQAYETIGLDYVSMQNEPDYASDWVAWTPEQMHTFVKNYSALIGHPLIFPESFQFRDVYSDPVLNDPDAVGLVSIIGGHFYGGGNYVHQNAINKGKRLWQTEVYTDGHDIDNCMIDAQQISDCMNNMFNAYVWWWVYDATDATNLMNKNGTIYKNGYTLGMFAKFLQPGSRRIGTSPYSPTSGVSVTAYTDAKGGLVIIAVNKGTAAVSQTFALTALDSVSLMYVTRTSATEDFKDVANAAVTSHSFTYTLPAKSITTFHQTFYPTNLAVGKTASQTGTGNWCNGLCEARYAVDGLINQQMSPAMCSHTASSSGQQYWRVDLGATYKLSTVKLYLRTDCCTDRAVGYSVYVTNSATPLDTSAIALGTISTQTWNQVYQFNVADSMAAQRYVEVRATNQFITICEAAVFGLPTPAACGSNPCVNGGTCVEGAGSFTCVCPVGYAGVTCSAIANPCTSSPCVNGGSCTVSGNSFVCTCASGYTGVTCDKCSGGFTQFVGDAPNNDIVSQFGIASYSACADLCAATSACVMFSYHAGWTGCFLKSAVGSTTTTDTNFLAGVCNALVKTPVPCASSPCVSVATCGNMLSGGYTCTCPAGYTGAQCQTNINECASTPCKNSGVCVDGVNGYTCTCPSLFTGVDCSGYASVAQLKAATQSGDGSWCNNTNVPCLAKYAVDNNYGQSVNSGLCAHTSACTGDQWWRVDLGAAYHVSQVTLYLRTDCCQTRVVGYGVYLSNSATALDSAAVAIGTISAQTSDQVYSFVVPSTVTATPQFVELRAQGQCLAVCEVAVLGTPA